MVSPKILVLTYACLHASRFLAMKHSLRAVRKKNAELRRHAKFLTGVVRRASSLVPLGTLLYG